MSFYRASGAFTLGYLVGTLPSADIASRLVTNGRVDLRESGSRNPGGVNAMHVLGPTPGRAVIVSDVAKGYVACALGRLIARDTGAQVAGVGAVLGHCYPVWSRLRGGKGVATSFGQSLYTFPAAAPLDVAVAVVVARLAAGRRPALVSTAAASVVWVGASVVWWRRRLPNAWGPPPDGRAAACERSNGADRRFALRTGASGRPRTREMSTTVFCTVVDTGTASFGVALCVRLPAPRQDSPLAPRAAAAPLWGTVSSRRATRVDACRATCPGRSSCSRTVRPTPRSVTRRRRSTRKVPTISHSASGILAVSSRWSATG